MKKLLLCMVAAAAVAFSSCTTEGEGGDTGQWTITVSVAPNALGQTHGKIEASRLRAETGDEITVTATPDQGYAVMGWTVPAGDAALTIDDAANTASFRMPEGDMAVRVSFYNPTMDDRGVTVAGVTWSTRNVGAPERFATDGAGMYYQFNTHVGWSFADPLTSSPAGIEWTNAAPYSQTWLDDPCPEGWRVPTKNQMDKLIAIKAASKWETRGDYTGRVFVDAGTGAELFLPALGYRIGTAGERSGVGEHGKYWCDLEGEYTSSWVMTVVDTTDGTGLYEYTDSNASSVRCVKQ